MLVKSAYCRRLIPFVRTSTRNHDLFSLYCPTITTQLQRPRSRPRPVRPPLQSINHHYCYYAFFRHHPRTIIGRTHSGSPRYEFTSADFTDFLFLLFFFSPNSVVLVTGGVQMALLGRRLANDFSPAIQIYVSVAEQGFTSQGLFHSRTARIFLNPPSNGPRIRQVIWEREAGVDWILAGRKPLKGVEKEEERGEGEGEGEGGKGFHGKRAHVAREDGHFLGNLVFFSFPFLSLYSALSLL
ncbi:hypothetical protein GGS21DRAFT_451186 [Xylaria nigripes]|nr:hypothetical protein GGS21DRAFT_451186 [Xylaria nigripes]